MSLIPCKNSRSWGQPFFKIAGGGVQLNPPALVKGVGTKRLGKGRVKTNSNSC